MSDFDYRELDDIIHSRIRLACMSILAAAEFAEFTYLRKATGATNGNLGMHLRKLCDADYVSVEKLFVSGKPLSRYRLTRKGRTAFRSYIARLERMLASTEGD